MVNVRNAKRILHLNKPRYNMQRSLFAAAGILLSFALSAQITINNSMTPQEYVENVLVGGGVEISNVTYNGVLNAPAGEPAIGSFTSNNTVLVLDSGLVLASGGVTQIPTGGPWSGGSGAGSDPDLVMIASGQGTNPSIYDKSVLEFDFIPTGDTISFNYVFASSEYN